MRISAPVIQRTRVQIGLLTVAIGGAIEWLLST
jgi:hypothetical protein